MRGATQTGRRAAVSSRSFNPRAPCGARLAAPVVAAALQHVSIHAPHAGRDSGQPLVNPNPYGFNPRAPCGARRRRRTNNHIIPFVSIHAPHAGRDLSLSKGFSSRRVSIHAPHAGRDVRGRQVPRTTDVSIHAPHAGRDHCFDFAEIPSPSFNPRAPCGARRSRTRTHKVLQGFNPRAPCGARHHGGRLRRGG